MANTKRALFHKSFSRRGRNSEVITINHLFIVAMSHGFSAFLNLSDEDRVVVELKQKWNMDYKHTLGKFT